MDAFPRVWFPDVFYHAVRIGYEVNERFSFYGGVDNITDRLPPLGLLGTAGGDPFDSIGRTFYVGAQIMCWTFIIHYGMTTLGFTAAQAQNYNIIAMFTFLASRFICTFLLAWLCSGLLLFLLALVGPFEALQHPLVLEGQALA